MILIQHVETKLLHDDRPEDEKAERKFTEEEAEERLRDGTPLHCIGRDDKTATAESNDTADEHVMQELLIDELLEANGKIL